MVFEHFNLFANMNVLQNLMLAPVDLKKATREEAKAEAMRLLDKVGVTDKAEAFLRSFQVVRSKESLLQEYLL